VLILTGYLAALAIAMAGGQSRIVAPIPSALGGAARVVWIPTDPAGDEVRCGIVAAGREWSCDDISRDTRGVAVVVGDGMIAAYGVGLPPLDSAPAQWGRVVRITAGGSSPDDLHDVTLTAFKPERPRSLLTRRFTATKDAGVHVAKIDDATFWVAGGDVDPDAFLVLDGPAVGSRRLATRHLREGPPEEPVFLSAGAAVALAGRIHGVRGDAADGAEVDLWELLQPDDPPSRVDDGTPLILRATATASASGLFQFDHVVDGLTLITARHPTLGRGQMWISSAGPPIDLELRPPTRATGRVVKRSLPVVGASLRFVPDADALVASLNPMDLVGAETRTADDGTFALALPPVHVGTVLVALDDGSRARIAVSAAQTRGDIALGDIPVPDGSHLTVRLLDGLGCGVVALGPLSGLGLAMVRATSESTVYELDLPEAGPWNLNAECREGTFGIDPPIVVVQRDRATTTVDARVVKTPG